MTGSVKLQATMKLAPEVLARVRKLLAGAPKHVSAHRVSVGLHEAEASAQAIRIASNKPNTNRRKDTYEGKPSAVKLIDVALWNEFGTDRTPERSWLRSWFDSKLTEHGKEMLYAMREEYKGRGSEGAAAESGAVARLAEWWVRDLASRIVNGTAGLDDLKASTQAARRAAGLPDGPPLYATHQLVDSFRAQLDGRPVV